MAGMCDPTDYTPTCYRMVVQFTPNALAASAASAGGPRVQRLAVMAVAVTPMPIAM